MQVCDIHSLLICIHLFFLLLLLLLLGARFEKDDVIR